MATGHPDTWWDIWLPEGEMINPDNIYIDLSANTTAFEYMREFIGKRPQRFAIWGHSTWRTLGENRILDSFIPNSIEVKVNDYIEHKSIYMSDLDKLFNKRGYEFSFSKEEDIV